jgi:hypothetical protein
MMMEGAQADPSLDPRLQVDERELEEGGAELDDPEDLVTLLGGIDDPDGRGEPTRRTRSRREDEAGWALDAHEEAGSAPMQTQLIDGLLSRRCSILEMVRSRFDPSQLEGTLKS